MTEHNNDQRAVAVGDIVQVVLPHSEVCQHLRLADHLRTVQILADGVQILDQNGGPYSIPITHGEAGVMVRGSEMWTAPIPATLWEVRRDGQRVSPDLMASHDAGTRWLQRHQAQSADWACKHNGYSIDPVTTDPGSDSSNDREGNDVNVDQTTTTADTDTDTTDETGGTEVEATEAAADAETGEGGESTLKGRYSLAEYGGYPTGARGWRGGGRRR